jgi:hypothetical protein
LSLIKPKYLEALPFTQNKMWILLIFIWIGCGGTGKEAIQILLL